MNTKSKFAISLVAAALSATALAQQPAPVPAPAGGVAVASEPGKAAVVSAVEISAQVVAIDKTTRTVTLKGPKGNVVDIVAGEQVKNFDQIKVGDLVRVTVSQGAVLSLMAPGAKPVEPTVTATGEAAPLGARPAGDVKVAIKGTVTVTAIDMKTRIATLESAEGRKFKVKAGKDIALEKVKVGDKVLAEFNETVAIAVEPAPKKAKKKSATK